MLDNIALCSEMPVADENGQEEEEEEEVVVEEEEDVEADVSLQARDGRHMRGGGGILLDFFSSHDLVFSDVLDTKQIITSVF